MSLTRPVRVVMVVTVLAGSLVLAPVVAAHTEFEIGEYHLTIGWLNEPTIVGEPNAVEVFITNHDEEPVTDLAGGDLTVVVSSAGQSTEALPLEPAFSLEGGFGTPGQYEAELLPTLPGDYTFQFGGSLHEEAVDLTVESGEDTFSPVRSSSEIEFPVKVPTLADVATRLDRIDGRIAEVRAGAGLAETANANATSALDAANRAILVGALVGGAGLVVAVVALFVAWRASQKGAGSA